VEFCLFFLIQKSNFYTSPALHTFHMKLVTLEINLSPPTCSRIGTATNSDEWTRILLRLFFAASPKHNSVVMVAAISALPTNTDKWLILLICYGARGFSPPPSSIHFGWLVGWLESFFTALSLPLSLFSILLSQPRVWLSCHAETTHEHDLKEVFIDHFQGK